MAAPTSSTTPHPTTLTATYTSPSTTTSKTFTHPLPPSSTSSLPEKTAYLSALRKSVTQLQEEINTFLTEKMEEDKAVAARAGLLKQVVDEKKEEENYGEEGVEDEG